MITVDTREKDIKHILEYFENNGIEYQKSKLQFGDYSNAQGSVYIERKRVGELAGNLTGKDKERFSREFERAKGSKVIVMVEGSMEDINRHAYRSRLSPDAFKKRIQTWANHYMFRVEFVKKEDAGKFIFETLK
jgi:ERCC4-type nuclease